MQIYIKGSVEAVELYQKAFNVQLTSEHRNTDNTFLHAELDVDGHTIAISEKNIEKMPRNTMQFCFQYGEGNEEAVKKAYQVLSSGGQILHPLGPCFFSPCMAGLIDKFGVHAFLYKKANNFNVKSMIRQQGFERSKAAASVLIVALKICPGF